LVGDLIPENYEVWNLILLLIEIINILLSYTFTDSAISHLKQLISHHNSMYITLFNDTLKPKHHFMIHYPTIITNSGPPRHYWCFRYEGKHKELKMYARSTTSRKNITLTLAKKMQLKFAHSLMVLPDKKIIVNDKHKIQSNYTENINNKLNLTVLQYACYTELMLNGIVYKKDYFLTKNCDKICLFKICEIVLINKPDSNVYVMANEIKLNHFNSHFESFSVDYSEEVVNRNCICNVDEFSGPPINISKMSSGQKMIRLKEFY